MHRNARRWPGRETLRTCWPRVRRWLLWAAAAFFAVTLVQVAALRFIDPPGSMYMLIRKTEAWRRNEPGFALHHAWRDLERISPHLALAVIASEDQNFLTHHGFDLGAIQAAREHNARGGRVRGASTISQQLARNLFLWGGRSWLRKGLEVWYTALIETLWPKRRILEVYLNVAEFGDGIYGAQAAAQRLFARDAAQLTPDQSARLAAVLPSPRRYSATDPGPHVQARAQWILRNMRQLGGQAHLDQLQ